MDYDFDAMLQSPRAPGTQRPNSRPVASASQGQAEARDWLASPRTFAKPPQARRLQQPQVLTGTSRVPSTPSTSHHSDLTDLRKAMNVSFDNVHAKIATLDAQIATRDAQIASRDAQIAAHMASQNTRLEDVESNHDELLDKTTTGQHRLEQMRLEVQRVDHQQRMQQQRVEQQPELSDTLGEFFTMADGEA